MALYGFNEITITVNHLAHIIKDYFGDGSRWGVKILYLQENERMGTAGSISLLPGKPKEPLILMNGFRPFNLNLDDYYLGYFLKKYIRNSWY